MYQDWVYEPMTLEPTESLSLDDLDAYVSVLKEISEQAYSTPRA
ncbi:MAG: hypothetical protein CM1200mP8_3930 [Chloroflexota bacterium]|nr:MAG: hypothetical protein CM1200mP8_3930 [Chloroflexota bacterium]